MIKQTDREDRARSRVFRLLGQIGGPRRGAVILTIASASAGAVLGAAVQSWSTSALRLTGITAASLSLLVIGLSASTLARDRILAVNQGELLNQSDRIYQMVVAALSSVESDAASRADDIRRSIVALSRQFGVQVTFQSIREINTNASVATDPSSALMLSASHEILVLDWLSQDGVWPDESMDRQYMSEHQAAVIEHVRSLGNSVTYKRICQVDDVSAPLWGVGTPEMFQHLRDMQSLHDVESMRVVVKFAEKKFPYKFLIIDREGLILQLQEFDDRGRLAIWGELIIRDPTRHFIDPFLAIWQDMEDAPRTRTITAQDLRIPQQKKSDDRSTRREEAS